MHRWLKVTVFQWHFIYKHRQWAGFDPLAIVRLSLQQRSTKQFLLSSEQKSFMLSEQKWGEKSEYLATASLNPGKICRAGFISSWAPWRGPTPAEGWGAGCYQSMGNSAFPWALILGVNDWLQGRGLMWPTFFFFPLGWISYNHKNNFRGIISQIPNTCHSSSSKGTYFWTWWALGTLNNCGQIGVCKTDQRPYIEFAHR